MNALLIAPLQHSVILPMCMHLNLRLTQLHLQFPFKHLCLPCHIRLQVSYVDKLGHNCLILTQKSTPVQLEQAL